jgi:hypothetical protein
MSALEMPPPPVELMVWFGKEPVMVTFVPATNDGIAVPVPPFATSTMPVKAWSAFHAAAPAALNVPSAGVVWVTTIVMPRTSICTVLTSTTQ